LSTNITLREPLSHIYSRQQLQQSIGFYSEEFLIFQHHVDLFFLFTNRKAPTSMAIKKKQSSVSSATNKKISGSRDKPPPLDQWIKPAIGLAMAMLGYQFFRGMVQQEIKRVNIEDELELRQVLFGETIDDGSIPPAAAPATTATPQNYAILCHPVSLPMPLRMGQHLLYFVSLIVIPSWREVTKPSRNDLTRI
jgi:hypothetical protein